MLCFPCNQFGEQEPKEAEEVEQWVCVRFPKKKEAHGPTPFMNMLGKIDVNGDGADPVYALLKAAQPGCCTDNIKWNFTSFLTDKEGRPVRRWGPPPSVGGVTSALAELGITPETAEH